MSRRWASLRGRRHSQTDETTENPADVFNFTSTPGKQPGKANILPRSSSLAYQVIADRPRTSTGVATDHLAPRFDIDTGSRPQTAQEEAEAEDSTCYTLDAPQDDMIGLAFGSPTHPPQNFYGMLNDLGPNTDAHAFELKGPFPDARIRKSRRKWKIGTLFKQKGSIKVKEPFYKANLPTEPTPVPSEPPTTDRKRSVSRPRSKSSRSKDKPFPIAIPLEQEDDEYSRGPPQTSEEVVEETIIPVPRTVLPKLQVEIPSAKLDRYTVMFNKVVKEQSPKSLLSRRSRTLEDISSMDIPDFPTPIIQVVHEEPRLQPPRARRKSSQASSKFSMPLTPPPTMISSAASKPMGSFSLFPNTSSTSLAKHRPAILTQGHAPLKRAITSPARLSPAHETFIIDKPPPLRVQKAEEKQLTSPEASTASTANTTAPWSAVSHKSAKSSVTTIDDEILFSIESFRDSQGSSGHFEMTRPTSTAVALYRSKSHNLKAKVPKPLLSANLGSRDSIAMAGEFQAIDETIAAVEKLTRVGVNTPPETPPRKLASSRAAKTPSPVRSPLRTVLDVARSETPSPVKNTAKAHMAHLLDGAPEPKALTPVQEQENSPVPTVEIKPLKPSVLEDSPPPVPAKDTRYVPVSKFARKPGTKPAKPARSFTDSVAMSAYRDSPTLHPDTFKPHSSTTSAGRTGSPLQNGRPRPAPQDSTRSAVPVQEALSYTAPKIPTIVHPATEVSIARSVSLARKVSQRVLVPARKTPDTPPWDVERLGTTLEEEEKRRSRMALLDTRPISPALNEGLPGHKIGRSVHALIETSG